MIISAQSFNLHRDKSRSLFFNLTVINALTKLRDFNIVHKLFAMPCIK